MKIRFMKKEDISRSTKLYYEIWPEDKGIKKYFQEKVKKKEGYVAIENKKIAGILAFTKIFFDEADYLDEVIVVKKFRNRGIASTLIKKFEENAKKRKSRRIFSSTEPTNKISIKMHKKLDYKRAGYIDDMWKEREKQIIFSKKL